MALTAEENEVPGPVVLFDVDVVEITDRHNEGFGGGRGGGFQIQYGTVQFKATLKKSSSIPYEGEMTAELYIIGSQAVQGRYGLLGKKITNFSFATGSEKFEFMSDDINMQQFEAGGTLGAEYEGYLVVLLDESGNVFKTKGSRSIFEEHAETIRKQDKGAVINQEGLLPLRRLGDYDDDEEVLEEVSHAGGAGCVLRVRLSSEIIPLINEVLLPVGGRVNHWEV